LVPNWEVATSNIGQKKKAARRRPASHSNLMIAGQAAINAGFDFRRYAMRPMPAKPRSIIAQLDGSRTAAIGPAK
jgi:hypothetical protein